MHDKKSPPTLTGEGGSRRKPGKRSSFVDVAELNSQRITENGLEGEGPLEVI